MMKYFEEILQVCKQVNFKLNKDKCLFGCTSSASFGEIISLQGVSPDTRKVQALTDMSPPKTKRELQSFLGIINYLSKFSPMTAEICEPLQKLTSVKADWTWNRMNQYLYNRTKKIIMNDTRLLQVRDGMSCGCDEVPDNEMLLPIALTSKSL